ncbi:MAG: antibiotic biosynthesis monooxygenase [Geminicoccaceae bacterium]|nr:MAG: antibiotic biosynthesis monooxygenase [Geminicoccaceae bacterium]
MFIAMNRFRVRRGQEAAFEQLWRNRESHLHEMAGFVAFHLLRGPVDATHTLFASHTIWASRAAFEAWTRSAAFRAAHQGAGSSRDLYDGPPQFEGFDVVETRLPAAADA